MSQGTNTHYAVTFVNNPQIHVEKTNNKNANVPAATRNMSGKQANCSSGFITHFGKYKMINMEI